MKNILIVTTFLLETVVSLQEWKEAPQPVEALEGQDAVLSCKVYNKVSCLLSCPVSHYPDLSLLLVGWTMFLEEESPSDLSVSWQI